MDRLGVFKVLGDSTRYAIYTELCRASEPVPTAELAARLDLHANTVRPHLERMREVGLLEMRVDGRGAVGRPQHCWSVVAAAPSLGLEPAGFRLLAHLLADVAARAGLDDEDLLAIGRAEGRERASGVGRGDDGAPVRTPAAACVAALVEQLAVLGFDPALDQQGDVATVAFSRCPFRELAAAFPDVVCQLHRGLTEGLLHGAGGDAGVAVRSFGTLVDVDPCRVELVLTSP